MATNECPNCGSILDLKEPICPYCGAPNPYYDGPAPARKAGKSEPPAPRPQPVVQQSNTTQGPAKQPVSFSVALFIVLLIFFWPAAIIYIIVKAVK